MQIEIYKLDDVEKKIRTRKLYEQNFDINDTKFIDYYYDNIIRRNEIVCMVEGDEILSMVHLNPYTYSIFGKEAIIHYLVAVATDEKHRDKGFMTKVLSCAIEYLESKNEPFCYVMPNNDDLKNTYGKFGFEEICKFNIDKFSNEKYDVFPVNTKEYVGLMKKEQEFLDLETEDYKNDLKGKIVMAKVLNSSFTLPDKKFSIDLLKGSKVYICQEV